METTHFIYSWLTSFGLSPEVALLGNIAINLTIIAITAVLAFVVTKRYLVRLLEMASTKTKNRWDDILVSHHFVKRVAFLLPILVIYMEADLLFLQEGAVQNMIRRLAMTFFVMAALRILDTLLLTARTIYSEAEATNRKPIGSYLDAIKITAYFLGGIFIIAILTGKSPWGILSVLGGFTVVLMLVFKDTILGFVAAIQLSGHDMVRVGDWVEMEKYGADGDVIDVSIHTVKVQNWDKTITTIPTYTLVSSTFKNWRGMSESGGRRIKRSIHIDMNSIRFCSGEMLARFEKFSLIRKYLRAKDEEIKAYNKEHQVDTSQLINGRRQTNIGIFRAYIVAYLRSHPKINQEMTFLVRHLEPTPTGLPVQIYVFSSDKVWANYEAIQADIFDHLLAAVPEFGLRLFQNPSGYDFRGLNQQTNMLQ